MAVTAVEKDYENIRKNWPEHSVEILSDLEELNKVWADWYNKYFKQGLSEFAKITLKKIKEFLFNDNFTNAEYDNYDENDIDTDIEADNYIHKDDYNPYYNKKLYNISLQKINNELVLDDFTSYQRKLIHNICNYLGLNHKTDHKTDTLYISKPDNWRWEHTSTYNQQAKQNKKQMQNLKSCITCKKTEKETTMYKSIYTDGYCCIDHLDDDT